MSDIPRYRPVANDKYGITDDVDGKLCEYRDYARLKAEVERLDTLCKQLGKQHSDISCENIMLRKAGDAMAERLMYQGYPETVPAWKAAKEGKPSA